MWINGWKGGTCLAILLYCPLHAITTLAAKSSQRRKKSTGRAQSLGWLCLYHRDIISEQLEALARTDPPKKDIPQIKFCVYHRDIVCVERSFLFWLPRSTPSTSVQSILDFRPPQTVCHDCSQVFCLRLHWLGTDSSEEQLPSASTCFAKLKLPAYKWILDSSSGVRTSRLVAA